MGLYLANDRRRYRRYIVQGHVWFLLDSVQVSGELLNVGLGGILFRSGVVLPEGREQTIHMVASCYPVAFEVQGEIVRVTDDRIAFRFLNQPQGLYELLLWLDQENSPWTGSNASADMDPAPFRQPTSSLLPYQMKDLELEGSLEYLYQQG